MPTYSQKIKLHKILLAHPGMNPPDNAGTVNPAIRKAFLHGLQMLPVCENQPFLDADSKTFISQLCSFLEAVDYSGGTSYFDIFLRNYLKIHGDKRSEDDRRFLNEILERPAPENTGNPSSSGKTPDKSIAVNFDLDLMEGDFKHALNRGHGVFGFSIYAYSAEIVKEFYAERLNQAMAEKRKHRTLHPLPSNMILSQKDEDQNGRLLDWLGEQLGTDSGAKPGNADGVGRTIEKWLTDNPGKDLLAFIVNYNMPSAKMKKIVHSCWPGLADGYGVLLEKHRQCMVFVWITVDPNLKDKIQIDEFGCHTDRRFSGLGFVSPKTPAEFPSEWIEDYFPDKFKELELCELDVRRYIKRLTQYGGEVLETWHEIGNIINELKMKGGSFA